MVYVESEYVYGTSVVSHFTGVYPKAQRNVTDYSGLPVRKWQTWAWFQIKL